MDKENFVIRIPVNDILSIIKGARYNSSDDTPVTPELAIQALAKPWAIVARDIDGTFFTEGFEDHKSCAERVASFHSTEYQVIHVLKNGIPRKNVTIEVNARFR